MNHRVRTRAKFFFERDQKFVVKGVTYGPFAPDAEGAHFGTPEKARSDFLLMAQAGVNLIRVYYVPSPRGCARMPDMTPCLATS